MSLSVETLAVARKYTDDSLAGAGAVAGVPCQIQSKTAITGGTRITFLWVDNNGDSHTTVMDVMNGIDGEDGKGIQSVSVNAENHLIITYSDGTTVDAGQIEIHSAVDSVNGQTGAVVLDAEDVGALPDDTPIPSKTSDLTNDSGFITKVVNDLVNYYLKSETYSKAEVDDIVTAIKNSRFEVVATLPTTDIKTNVIYLVPKSPSQTSNVKDEYINLDGTTAGWEKIGDTEIDLSDYVTTQALNTALADYTTTADLTTLLAGKQDTLTFDNAPTENSNNPVKSGGVYAANQTLTSAFVNNVNENGCKNILPNYITPFSSGGANVAIDDDGIITVTASSALTGNCNIYPAGDNNIEENKKLYLPKGTYIGSGCPSGGSGSTYYVNFYNQSLSANLGYDYGEGVEFTLDSDTWIVVRASVRSGYTISGSVVFKPMITLATDVPSDYAHYVSFAKTNRQLTQDSVTWDDLSEVGAVNKFDNTMTSQTLTDADFTVNADKSVTVVVSSTLAAIRYISCKVTLKAGTYRLSGCPSGGDPDGANGTYRLTCYSNTDSTGLAKDGGDGAIFTINKTHNCSISIEMRTGVTSGTYVFKPMLTDPSYNGPYVPYAKTNKELTDDVAELLNDGKPYSFGIMGSNTKPSFLNGDTLANKTILEIFSALPINSVGESYGTFAIGSEISVVTYSGTNTLFSDIMSLTGLTSIPAGLLTIKKIEAQRGLVTYNTGNKIFNCRIMNNALETCYLMELTPIT